MLFTLFVKAGGGLVEAEDSWVLVQVSRFWPRFLGSCSPRKGKSIRFPLLTNCICDGKLDDFFARKICCSYMSQDLFQLFFPSTSHPLAFLLITSVQKGQLSLNLREKQSSAKFFQSISKGFCWNSFFWFSFFGLASVATLLNSKS